jgi:hypothetical protein
MKILILSFIFTFLIIGCKKKIEIDEKLITPKLVVNSVNYPESVFSVEVSKSLSVFERDLDELPSIYDAQVSLYEKNSGLLTNIPWSGGLYSYYGVNAPVSGKTYRLEVAKNGFESVTAESTVPLPVIINSVQLLFDSIREGEIHEVKINFNDDINFENYYSVKIILLGYKLVYNATTSSYDTNAVNSSKIGLSTQDISNVYNNISDSYNGGGIMFDDNFFNGQSKTLSSTFEVYSNYLSDPDVVFNQIEVSVLSLSREVFEYVKSGLLYNNSADNPFAEPVRVFSNIDNGIGVFGFQTKSSLVIDVLN